MLAKLGCSVTIASSGEEAVEIARQDGFDLVLMDCRLPGIDGFKAASLIRADQPHRSRVPIIALTASAHESDRKRCLEAGMDDHIGKPVDLSALQQALAKWASPSFESELQRR
jgi:CheY-like chemotaxis protein